MTTFTVDTLSDDPTAGLTLREALAAADGAAGADTIEFAAGIQGGTITLTGGQLVAGSDVTVDGGTGVTIDANELSRVLQQVNYTNVVLENLTITGGKSADSGGGIASAQLANLKLIDTTVSGNSTTGENASGGGLINFGTLTLIGSTVSGNSTAGKYASGGGIQAFAATSITDSTISGNSTTGERAGGGGIYSRGTMELTNSTVSDNSTTGAAAAGGGIYARFGTLSLTNSTVSDNSTTGAAASGGGIYGRPSAVTLANSTVSGNSTVGRGGGIYLVGDSLTLTNSIVAGNRATLESSDIGSPITSSNGHNIFGSDVAGNVAGDLENVATALLFAGGLAENGGPTQTIALLDDPTNPALAGALAADAPDTDQRGEARPAPAGTDPDVGAFELSQSPPSDEIVGTKRADFLKGTSGGDVIRGLAGNDELWGLAGDDKLFGDNGKDSLFGKAGIDQSTGGLGADRFVFRATTEAAADGPVYEEILDFNRAEGDRIDLRGIDADTGKPGNQPFRFVGDAPLTGPGQLHVEAFDGDFLVSGTVDADLAADFAILVRTGLASLRASDFLL